MAGPFLRTFTNPNPSFYQKDSPSGERERPAMRMAESYILNFSFGKVLDRPYEFDWTFEDLQAVAGEPVSMHFEMLNDVAGYEAERQLEAYHTTENKQQVGYNPHAAARTGTLKVHYPDFLIEQLHAFNDAVNITFGDRFLAYLLTFLQRRRVMLGVVRLRPADRVALSFPALAAGERIDSVAWGPPLVEPEGTLECITKAVSSYSRKSPRERGSVQMLLRRYNDALNLPYVYERVEAFWRILEAHGKATPTTPGADSEYQRLKPLLGIKKESASLKHFLTALVSSGVTFTDRQVADAFDYRNKVIHEYLNPALLQTPSLAELFLLLQESVEGLIAASLSLDLGKLVKPAYTTIENRIL